MIRLHIIVEGQTEEEFVNSVLNEYLGNANISTDARCVTTNRKRKLRGGLVSYKKAMKDITFWLKQDRDRNARFTTMFDLYALPNSFPNFEEALKIADSYEKVNFLEKSLAEDISDSRFIPYIQLHEFEALILTDPSKLIESFPNREHEVQQLTEMCKKFESPELINEGNTTAPSKRIIDLIPEYEGEKVVASPLTARKIGIAKIRQKCPHFNDWISKLESLSLGLD